MYHHMLIATDGSDLAEQGLDHGLDLAAKLGAKVTVVTVSEPMDRRIVRAAAIAGVPDAAADYEASVEKELAGRFAEIVARAAARGVTAGTISLIHASPAEAIIEQCDASGCDLIVMSSHGRRGLRRFLMGSQTSEVLGLSRVPVLVVRPAAG